MLQIRYAPGFKPTVAAWMALQRWVPKGDRRLGFFFWFEATRSGLRLEVS
jgi:hypothetical protein